MPQDPVTRDTKCVGIRGGAFYATAAYDFPCNRRFVASPSLGTLSQGFRTYRPARLPQVSP